MRREHTWQQRAIGRGKTGGDHPSRSSSEPDPSLAEPFPFVQVIRAAWDWNEFGLIRGNHKKTIGVELNITVSLCNERFGKQSQQKVRVVDRS